MAGPATGEERRIALAAVAGPHGIKGEVRLKLFTDDPEALTGHERLLVGGTVKRLLHLGSAGKTMIARFDGIADRTAAEGLRGSLIEIDRADLPELDEGEYYHADLIGLQCVDAAGNPIGTVAAVENFGAGDLLEIETPHAKRSLIPFRAGIADLRDGQILVDPDFLA